jgi:hypothetical protein
MVRVGVKVFVGVKVREGVKVIVGVSVSVGVSVIVLVRVIVGVNVSVLVAVKIVAVLVEAFDVAVSLYPGFDISLNPNTINATQLINTIPTITRIGIIHFFVFFVGSRFVPIFHSLYQTGNFPPNKPIDIDF